MPGVRGGVKPADLLATISAEIEARREQLRAAVEEYEQLLSAADALEREARGARAPVVPKSPVVRKVRVAAKTSPTAAKAPVVRRMRITSKASIVRKAPALPEAKAASRADGAPSPERSSRQSECPRRRPLHQRRLPRRRPAPEKKAPAARVSRCGVSAGDHRGARARLAHGGGARRS